MFYVWLTLKQVFEILVIVSHMLLARSLMHSPQGTGLNSVLILGCLKWSVLTDKGLHIKLTKLAMAD